MRNDVVRVCRKMMVQRQQFVSSSSRVLLKGIQRTLEIAQYTIPLLQNGPFDNCHKKKFEQDIPSVINIGPNVFFVFCFIL